LAYLFDPNSDNCRSSHHRLDSFLATIRRARVNVGGDCGVDDGDVAVSDGGDGDGDGDDVRLRHVSHKMMAQLCSNHRC
jgi:hypothetical protein